MPHPKTTLRPAAPTLDDGRLFARYLDEAAGGFFRFMLGRRYVEILAAAFIQPGHDLSHQHVTFAERDGTVVGMVSAYTAEQHRQSSREPLKRAAGRNLRLSIISNVFRPLMRILDRIGDGDYYLQAVAVDENLRGQGIGAMLMDAIENRARDAGATRLCLHVAAANKTSREIYERRGMTVDEQWPKCLPIPGLRFYRMTKPL
jgi:ribosomal protein S18 acetylase RimI-like enzyme